MDVAMMGLLIGLATSLDSYLNLAFQCLWLTYYTVLNQFFEEGANNPFCYRYFEVTFKSQKCHSKKH
jgi:hypothetical protein